MIKPEQYKILAEVLVNSSEESSRRTAVSRSYYAVYNQFVMILEEGGVEWREINIVGSIHTYLIRCLNRSGKRYWKRIGKKLEQIKNYRIEADYYLDRGEFSKNESLITVKIASDFWDKNIVGIDADSLCRSIAYSKKNIQ